MRYTLAPAILALVSQALGATIGTRQNSEVPKTDFDAIIVGGGPSGLSALSGLARVRRNVLLIDSGVYRNGPTRHLHDLIGLDGLTPAYYRWLAREQLAYYNTVELTNGTVTKIEPQENNTYFRVITDNREPVTARKIVLGTGLRDILPETPGIRENWGKGIFWCPWCDGHEHADQGLGLLSSLESVAGLVREVASLNKDVAAFVNGTDTPESRALAEKNFPDWEKYLELKKVKVYNSTIERLERLQNATLGDPSLPTYPEHDKFRVHLADGEKVERDAFLTNYDDEQASSVGPDLGVRLDGGRLAADNSKGLVTNIPGVYAIGDANADNVTNIPHALFTGKRTAVYLHVQLERENALAELEAYKGNQTLAERDFDEDDLRAVWKRMNGEPGDLLYAGEYRQ
ncbi:unnamed protein product [Clonostachys rosea]|uniref:FAD/NAD(P)-binding domain-containing protein n=1 Tax=Bionectria ochroleuca TaxID=29856 RepID=A0ABY6TTH5_BIOOC|nr:unnamed protein product [Clonostachys rosea]